MLPDISSTEMPWNSSFKGEEKEENRGKVCMEKILGCWTAAHSFSLVTLKAQAQKIGTQKRAGLWA